eukprot:1139077-Pelagomonas_calceolata.AAC.6
MQNARSRCKKKEAARAAGHRHTPLGQCGGALPFRTGTSLGFSAIGSSHSKEKKLKHRLAI